MSYFDAAARDNFTLSKSDELTTDAHVIDECLDGLLSEMDEPEISDEICFRKGDIDKIDLSSFRPQKFLNPKIWIDGRINSRVRLRLLDIADDFFDTLKVGWVKPIDVILTGSLANYNWSRYSDFDLHILIDFDEVDERTEFVKEYFDTKKNDWNNRHEDLTIYGFPVEVYVQNIHEPHTSSGVYSLEKDTWLVKPNPYSIRPIMLDKYYIKEQIAKYSDKICKLYDAVNKDINEYEAEKYGIKVKKLFDKIKGIRKEALKDGNEMSPDNIVFKALRRMGYLDKLLELKHKTYDKSKAIGK